jgi:hypothetical protein
MKRGLALLLGALAWAQPAWSEDAQPAEGSTGGAQPAPEPREGAPEAPGAEDGSNGDNEERGFDGEADYLALADAPLFLPRSYLYWGTPVGSRPRRERLVFALEYALHLPIYSDLRDRALTGGRWAGAVTLSFEGDLRMLAVESKPVRMPSYRPSLSGQLFHIWHRDRPILLSLRSGLYHYSNGQEQCTFSPDLTDESEGCLALTDQVTDAPRALNDRNGNFSTNGWLAELFGRVHQVNSKGVAVGHLSLGLLTAGLINRGPGAMEPALRRLYGWGRLGATFEAKKRFGWATMTLRASASYYPRSSDRVPAASGSGEVVLGPYWLTGLGFFGRYYGGRDFYNAFFVDRLQQFAAGVAWDGERPLKFRRDD